MPGTKNMEPASCSWGAESNPASGKFEELIKQIRTLIRTFSSMEKQGPLDKDASYEETPHVKIYMKQQVVDTSLRFLG